MTRQFDPLKAGLTPEAVEGLYNIVLTQKLVLEAKFDRIKKELAVGACYIEDENNKKFKFFQIFKKSKKQSANLEMARKGMLNLITYIEAKVQLEDELNVENGSIDLVNKHLKWVKEYYERKNSDAKI